MTIIRRVVLLLKTYEYCRCVVWQMDRSHQFEIEYMRDDEDISGLINLLDDAHKTGWSCLSEDDNGIYGIYSNNTDEQITLRKTLGHTIIDEFMVYVDIDTKEVFQVCKNPSGKYDILKFDKGNWIPKEEMK